jgi:monofunctional glycosyltransferase
MESIIAKLTAVKNKVVVVVFSTYVFSVPLVILCYKYVSPPFTPHQAISSVAYGTEFRHLTLPSKQISPNVTIAVIAAEDARYLDHHGLDIQAIMEAWKRKSGGGSTVSQQLAKNLFFTMDANWLRKLAEVYPTLLLELILGKHRIIELYVNSIEFEAGIFGVEAAAKFYFNRSASQITRSQAAWLAVCLPNPKGCKKRIRAGKLNARHRRVMQEMNYLEMTSPKIREFLGK